jgi:hypothetical protein
LERDERAVVGDPGMAGEAAWGLGVRASQLCRGPGNAVAQAQILAFTY